MISEESLAYAAHLPFYAQFMVGDSERDTYWQFEAQEMHALSVLDAVREVQIEIIGTSSNLRNEEALNNLNFGAARRSRLIWSAFRQLHHMVPPNRLNPMLHDDVFEVSRSLNDIYIHIRGLLDNYAWSLLYLSGMCDRYRRSEIDIFGKKFQSILKLFNCHETINVHSEWNRELKERRDPVAHRIPLSVPPSIFSQRDHEIFVDLNNKYHAAIRKFSEMAVDRAPQNELDAVSAEADTYYEKMQKIGRFAPVIVHDPKDGGIPIYPTVPEDIGTLVKLIRGLNLAISARFTSKDSGAPPLQNPPHHL